MKRPTLPLRQIVILATLSTSLGLAVLAKDNLKSIELPDDNTVAKLKPGPGVDTAESNCMGCHSTDYIVLQPGGDARQWQAEVTKMIEVFGAPVSDKDAKVIVNYLATAYAPAPAKTTKKSSPGALTQGEKAHAH